MATIEDSAELDKLLGEVEELVSVSIDDFITELMIYVLTKVGQERWIRLFSWSLRKSLGNMESEQKLEILEYLRRQLAEYRTPEEKPQWYESQFACL